MWKDEYQRWMSEPTLDPILKEELQRSNEKDLEEMFYTSLEFGTGGMRGILGPGLNRMNRYTIRRANDGLARYLTTHYAKEELSRGVVIAHDNRFMSREFAFESAKVLASYGIRSFLFDALRPTPELSFAVRYLHALAGIVVTASHNPPNYNGYKIYDEFGCQYTPEYADEIVGLVNQVTDVFSVHAMSDEAMKQDGYLHILDGTIDTAYLELVKSIRLYPKATTTIKTVFTPLHGTSAELGSRLLKECGYPFEAVQEQMVHDPSFSTVKSPNPENPAAFEHAIQLGKKVDADLLIATDPDADRLGVAVKHQGDYVLLTGNQTGAILIRYLLEEKKKLGLLPSKGVVFNTVVTSDLGAKIARSFGFEVISTLTGFKYIGEQARFLEGTDKTFFFGYEESYGYVINDGVRDKDSLQAMALAIEAANYYWNQEHKTLVDVLYSIYETYGNYREDLVNIELAGMEGKKRIDAIMEYFRQHSPKKVAGFDIVATEDYEKRVRQEGNQTTALVLPVSNVLKFFLSDGSWFVLRPSGTEPKLKVYIGVVGVTGEMALSTIDKIKMEVKAVIDTVVI